MQVRRLWILIAVMALAAGPVMAAEDKAAASEDKGVEVTTPVGNVGISLTAKFIYAWAPKDDEESFYPGPSPPGPPPPPSGLYSNTQYPGRSEFNTTMIDMTVVGRLTDQISYNVELAAIYNPEAELIGKWVGDLTGSADQGEMNGSRFGVRQASIVIQQLYAARSIKPGPHPLPPHDQRRGHGDRPLRQPAGGPGLLHVAAGRDERHHPDALHGPD